MSDERKETERNRPLQEEAAGPEPAPEPLDSEAVTLRTASLWKYRPVPDAEPEPGPETRSNETVYPAGRVVAAQARGKKHKHEGSNCDDWYETAHWEEVVFLAVSDGAGSKRFSRIGAKASCQAAVGYLAQAFAARPALCETLRLPPDDPAYAEGCQTLAGLIQQAMRKAFEAVEAAYYSRAANPAFIAALNRRLELSDFSATLLVAAMLPLRREEKENLIVSCQIGDGCVAALRTGGPFDDALKLLGEPDGGDFSGETEFLTSPDMRRPETLQRKTRMFRGVFDLVLMMTDGVADDYYPNAAELPRLYFDLAANGILDIGEAPAGPQQLDRRQIALLKRLPEPLAYPWVNDQSVKIPLHSVGRICETAGLSLADLWEDPTALRLCRMDMDERMKSAPPDERLRLWLDHYVRRGSFDDRTLVILVL